MIRNTYKKFFFDLSNYIKKKNYKGWDPFDGLNSKIFQSLPYIKNNKWARLAWLQFFKRSPINLRPLFLVPKEENPKGLALFLGGYINLYKKEPKNEYKNIIADLTSRLIAKRSKGYSGAGWGYNFDWQARAFFQPKYTPTSVATSFAVEALLRAATVLDNKAVKDMALSSAAFILNDLRRSYDKEGDFIFSYSPLDQTQIYNAGLLGAKTLVLIWQYTREKSILNEALKNYRYVAKNQRPDGSWTYGTLPHHQWIDNFHTGYNLEAYYVLKKITGTKEFDSVIEKGMEYYLHTFWTEEGIPKYYSNRIYPIDPHNTAQLIITLTKAGLMDKYSPLINKVLDWTFEHMYSPKGYFYYQKQALYTNKIPYMRWTQAWMFYALSFIV